MKVSDMPKFLKNLRAGFRKALNATQVDVEKFTGGRRYRLAVVSPTFEGLPHLKRQDRIWSVVDELLKREEIFKISVIHAFSPSELQTRGVKRSNSAGKASASTY